MRNVESVRGAALTCDLRTLASTIYLEGGAMNPFHFSGANRRAAVADQRQKIRDAVTLSLLWLCISVGALANDDPPVSGPSQDGAMPAADTRDQQPEPRSSKQILLEIRELEKQASATKAAEPERARAIARLCGVFIELGEHPDITDNRALQSLSVQLRARLRGLERRTVKELRRRQVPEPTGLSATKASSVQSRPPYSGSSASSSHVGDSAWQDSGVVSGAAPGPDFGWGLVNLIRQTIQPDYWSVAGGPGKAIYYGHSRALVIHGSWRVHEEVAALLTALRGG